MRERKRISGLIGTASWLAIIGVAVGASLWGISACRGIWDTPVQLAKLLVSDVIVAGASGHVLISVADMLGTGAASIQFGTLGDPAITFTNIDATTITIEGQNGFVVLESDVTTTAGKGTLIVVNAATGVVSGQIVKLTFTVTAANPTFTVAKAKVKIGSDSNTWITAWDTSSLDYYTK